MPQPRANNTFQVPNVIDPPGTICLIMTVPNEETHIQNLIGAIAGLTMARAYADKPGVRSADIATVWRRYIQTIQFTDCASPNVPSGCVDYDLKQPWEAITPVNPYLDSTLVPPGYLKPPWHVIPPAPYDAVFRVLGYQTDDILVTLESLPPGSWPTILPPGGLPHVRLSFSGKGEINVSLLAVPIGGDAYIQIDGDANPLHAHTFPLTLDLTSLPVQNDVVVEFSHEFKTDGKHTIDVTFLPRIIADPPFVLYGGGIRGVQLCGFTPPNPMGTSINASEVTMENLIQVIEDANGNCLLQYRCCEGAAWITAATQASVPPGGQPGTGSGGTPPPSKASQYCMELIASKTLLIPSLVSTGDTITLDSCDGSAFDGETDSSGPVFRLLKNGDRVYGGQDVGSPRTGVAGDPVTAAPHLSVICAIGATPVYVSLPVGIPVAVPSGISSAQAVLQVNDSSIGGIDGGASLCVTVKNNAPKTWTHAFDLTQSPGPFVARVLSGQTNGHWVAGSGWQHSTYDNGTDSFHLVALLLAFPVTPITLTSITVYSEFFLGTIVDPATLTAFIWDSSGSPMFYSLVNATPPSPIVVASPSTVSNQLLIDMVASNVHDPTPPDGSVTITKVVLSGTGDDPF